MLVPGSKLIVAEKYFSVSMFIFFLTHSGTRSYLLLADTQRTDIQHDIGKEKNGIATSLVYFALFLFQIWFMVIETINSLKHFGFCNEGRIYCLFGVLFK